MEYKDPGRYIPIIYLLYSWGSRFGVPSRVPLYMACLALRHYARYLRARAAASVLPSKQKVCQGSGLGLSGLGVCSFRGEEFRE